MEKTIFQNNDRIALTRVGWIKLRNNLGVICNSKIPLKLKGKFYHAITRPAMLYKTECLMVKSQ